MPMDFSNYIDLTVYDQEPTDIYTNALEYARTTLPELTVRQGTPEDAILQAVSYISSLNIASINRLPNRLMLGILGIMGITKNEGEYGVISLEFSSITYSGAVVPSGTLLRYDLDGMSPTTSIYFQTIDDLIIDAIDGSMSPPLPSATVDARCMEVMRLPSIPNNSEMIIESVISGVLPPFVASTISSGSNPETDSEYVYRAQEYLGSLTSAFSKSSQVDGHILSTFPNVTRARTYDVTDYDVSTVIGDPDVPGAITTFVYGRGDFLTNDEKYEILTSVYDRTIAGLKVNVEDAYIADVEIEISVFISSSYSSSIVESNIKNTLVHILSPVVCPIDSKLRKSYVASVLSKVAGVIAVESILFTSVDTSLGTINLDGDIEFINKGTLTNIPGGGITATIQTAV
jgi:hypothetical protein